jgi:hypothetical protein
MEKFDLKIIEEYRLKFTNSQNIFTELENSVKQYSNGFWGTSRLLDHTPFFYERYQSNNIRIGKKLTRIPKNKEDKFFHVEDNNKNIVAVYGYIANWDLPGDYIFVKYKENETEYYEFDIENKLVSVQINFYEKGKIIKSIVIQIPHRHESIVIENYFYDGENRMVEIKCEHKDKITFSDEKYFPNNIYKSIFKIEYNGNETIPNKILWNEKIVYTKK